MSPAQKLTYAIALLDNIADAGAECGAGDVTWDAIRGVIVYLADIRNEIGSLTQT